MDKMTSQAGQLADLTTTEDLSDVELLTSALEDALVARESGLVIGPSVDEVAWRRSVRRAVRADRVCPDVDGAA